MAGLKRVGVRCSRVQREEAEKQRREEARVSPGLPGWLGRVSRETERTERRVNKTGFVQCSNLRILFSIHQSVLHAS